MGTTSFYQGVRSETNYVQSTEKERGGGSSSRLVFQFEEAIILLVLKLQIQERLKFWSNPSTEKMRTKFYLVFKLELVK